MKIAYTALGKSNTGKPIFGHVFFDSKVQSTAANVIYKILAYQFLCEGDAHTAKGVAADRISFLIGPPPGDTVVPGMANWHMGKWVTNTGVIFKTIDNTIFNPPLKSDYLHLPPRMELNCQFAGGTPATPFYPVGWLKLIWNPQFTTIHGLMSNFFQSQDN